MRLETSTLLGRVLFACGVSVGYNAQHTFIARGGTSYYSTVLPLGVNSRTAMQFSTTRHIWQEGQSCNGGFLLRNSK